MVVARIIPVRRMPANLSYLDYFVPEELTTKLLPGQLVTIPFRTKQEFGIVAFVNAKTESQESKIKPITSLIDERPFITKPQLKFLSELAAVYATPIGFLLKSALPPLQKRKLALLNKSIQVPTSLQANLLHKSGKSEFSIYRNREEEKLLLRRLLKSNEGTTLILVPTVFDVERVFALLPESQAKRSVKVSSENTSPEFFAAWRDVWTHAKDIIVGTRRALFLPFEKLSQIIILDEGNQSFKSWDMAPRFHTRDAARILAAQYEAHVHLLSHTPSLETYFAAQRDGTLLGNESLTPRNAHIIYLADERRKKNYSLLSEVLLEDVSNNIDGISFLYLNKRGSVSYVACRDCGLVARCPHCQTTLSYHESTRRLLCHQCNFQKPLDTYCSKCHGSMVSMFGGGTQLLERELTAAKNLLGRKIIRIDSDTDTAVAPAFAPGDIVIGTQAVWPFIPWKDVALMAFVNADTSLFVPEYTVAEELWQQIGLAYFELGETGEMYIQTAHPEHYVFRSLMQPALFYETELKVRTLFGYPPTTTLVKFFSRYETKELAEAAGKKLFTSLELTKSNSQITIIKNQPSVPYFFKGGYWHIVLAKIKHDPEYTLVKSLTSCLPSEWKVDVNPIAILSL